MKYREPEIPKDDYNFDGTLRVQKIKSQNEQHVMKMLTNYLGHERLYSTLNRMTTDILSGLQLNTNYFISIIDKLPEETGRYWCYIKVLNDLGNSYYQWNCEYNAEEKRFIGALINEGDNVTHWMPLAEPPKDILHIAEWSEKAFMLIKYICHNLEGQLGHHNMAIATNLIDQYNEQNNIKTTGNG